jgi:hypothetical protein
LGTAIWELHDLLSTFLGSEKTFFDYFQWAYTVFITNISNFKQGWQVLKRLLIILHRIQPKPILAQSILYSRVRFRKITKAMSKAQLKGHRYYVRMAIDQFYGIQPWKTRPTVSRANHVELLNKSWTEKDATFIWIGRAEPPFYSLRYITSCSQVFA